MGPHRTKDQKNKMKTTSYKCDKGQVWLQFQDLQVDMKKAHRLIPNRVCVCVVLWMCTCTRVLLECGCVSVQGHIEGRG